MPEYIPPGVYIDDVDSGPKPIEGVSTSVTGLVGVTERGPVEIQPIFSFSEFTKVYGNHLCADKSFLSYAVQGFFENGGKQCYIARIVGSGQDEFDIDLEDYLGNSNCGLQGLEAIPDISLVLIPDHVHPRIRFRDELTRLLIDSCEKLGDRFAILSTERDFENSVPVVSYDTAYAALYYSWIWIDDPRSNNELLIPPIGHVAGIYARTDQTRGVYKAPVNETVIGAKRLQHDITKSDQEVLNPKGVNCLRDFHARGIRVWGARTLSSDPEWRYVNVRRLFIFLEQSIEEGTQWVVFEPNEESTWTKVTALISQFLFTVWRGGGLAGKRPEEAFFVRCDRSTMTQDDLDQGRLVCLIGVSPVKPAEFVIFQICHTLTRTG